MAKLNVNLCTKCGDVDFEPFLEIFAGKSFKDQLNFLLGFHKHRQVIAKAEKGVQPYQISETERMFLKKLLVEYMCAVYPNKR